MIHLDTSFSIDLIRERRRRRPGPAHAFLEARGDEPLALSVFSLCELEAGVLGSQHATAERASIEVLATGLAIAYPDERFARAYAEALTAITARGRTIATMDLLIGICALVDAATLVTRNRKHFDVIPGLTVTGY